MNSPTAIPPSNPLPPALPTSRLDARWVGLACFFAALALLILVWPYQNWFFEARTSVLSGWLRVVLNDSEWQFCLVVPPLVGFLIYTRREELKGLPLRGHWSGAAVFALGLAFYWMGYKVNTGYLGFIAAQVIMAGLILLIGGKAWMRALFFPWLFLSFMWPMFPLEERLAFPLRMITANVSGQFLNLIGVGVIREGTALYSAPDLSSGLAPGDLFRLDVEEPCSGIRSLFALMMVSALYGYLSLKAPFSRLLLFLSAIPLAMAGNFVRMVLLALGSKWFGAEVAVGRNIDGHQEMSFFHSMAGYAVFAVALSGMFALCSLLETKHWQRLKNLSPTKSPHSAPTRSSHLTPRTLVGCATALALALAGIGWCATIETDPKMAEPGVRLNLPLTTGQYQGQQMAMTAQERNVLDPGVELSRTYYGDADGTRILTTVIVGGPGKRTLHRPEVCLPGQGWSIADTSKLPVPMADGSEITVTLLRLFRDRETEDGGRVRLRALNLYWYVGSDGSTVPDYYGHISQGYRDAVLKDLNHRWSMISIFSPVSEARVGTEDPFQELRALEELKSFITGIAPQLRATPVPASPSKS